MFQPRPQTRSSMVCCAVVIPTRRTTPVARLSRLWDRLADAVADWRRQRYEARHLGYLDAASLNDMGISRFTLRELGADPNASHHQDRPRFP